MPRPHSNQMGVSTCVDWQMSGVGDTRSHSFTDRCHLSYKSCQASIHHMATTQPLPSADHPTFALTPSILRPIRRPRAAPMTEDLITSCSVGWPSTPKFDTSTDTATWPFFQHTRQNNYKGHNMCFFFNFDM